MSKMDNLRAMREARYEQSAARAARPTTRAVRPAHPAAELPPAEPERVTEQLCGHRNMGGRTCTRELGHAAKSHRYS